MIRTALLVTVVFIGSLQLLADGWHPLPVLAADVVAAAFVTVLIVTRWTRAR